MTRFSPVPFPVVGFDLDGTLLDTSGDLAAAVNHALAAGGRAPLSVAAVVARVGGGVRQLLTQALGTPDGAEVDRLLPLLLDFYNANIAVDTRPYPGAIEAIDTLRARGVRCTVVTNKLAAPARRLLEHFGLLDCFACVIAGDTPGVGRNKPAPDPILAAIDRCGGGRAAFVGDSRYDVMAARAAGVPVVACSFGFTADVAGLGADAVIDRYDQLMPALERLGATSSTGGAPA